MVLACGYRREALILAVATMTMAGCQSGSSTHGGVERIKSDPKEAFSAGVFGVAASPRVTDARIIRKGGGRSQIGKPYKVRGTWYYPKDQPGYVKIGKASWYGASFHGRLTANGEVYDMFGLSAAHPTLPLPSYARVTNTKNGSTVIVRVNDRGPYHDGRVMDLSSRAAELLGYKQDGIGDIKVEYVGRAPTEGDDTQMLMASYRPGTGSGIDDGMASGVMVASNETPMQTPAFASAMIAARAAPLLPGVRPPGGVGAASASASANGSIVDLDAMSVGSIIAASAGGTDRDFKAEVPLPHRRRDAFRTIVSSYAPAPRQDGAAGALQAMAGGTIGERIEIGMIESEAVLDAIRRIAADRGRLIVDSSRDAKADAPASYAFQANAGEDVDALLQFFWHAGADQAFVLRN